MKENSMANQIFENHTVVTKDWKRIMCKACKVLGYYFALILMSFLLSIAGLLWITTLGHIVVVKAINHWMTILSNRADIIVD